MVITYRELRLLELAVLRASHITGQQVLDIQTLINVDVDQFYGIEIEDFLAQIAQVALWLTDHQMNMKISEEFGAYLTHIPLKATPHIVCGNALQLDWASVLPPEKCSYILGNPPFVGAKFMDDAQREDSRKVFHALDNGGLLDFVAAWYVKAACYIKENSAIHCAFVSTNSITQGEQVGVLWSWMLAQGIKIHFAHRTFSWNNEARGKAAVHCVIIGFGSQDVTDKIIYEYDDTRGEPHAIKVGNINPYLVDAPDIVLPRRSTPICKISEIGIGNKPIDGGYYLFTEQEKVDFTVIEPLAEKYFRRWIGAEEFLNGSVRWCLWLGECAPEILRKMPHVLERIELVRQYRLGKISNKKGKKVEKLPPKSTQDLASTPTKFHVEFIPKDSFMVIPEVSSERRTYIPLGYFEPQVLASNKLRLLPNATLFEFGVLSSSMHMSWTRQTCGRMKSDFQYSISIVYNNFLWPDCRSGVSPRTSNGENCTDAFAATSRSYKNIDAAAQAVLDARAVHINASLADLYDPLIMQANLLKAHQVLDKAVDAAYGYKPGLSKVEGGAATDAARVAFLFERYQALTSLLPAVIKAKVAKTKKGGR